MPRLLATFVSALLLLATAGPALADNPKVQMETTEGTITIELYPDKAPKSVENFLAYVDEGYYDGTVFHRVIDGFMIQGGGFTGELQKKPSKDAIENEADNGLKNERGAISMARTGDPHSATSQFFINHKDNDFLNHSGKNPRGWGYAVFGKVTDGMEVVDKIATTPTGGKGPFPKDVPQSTIVIEKVTRIDG
jgi:cyclophilin family peptidyl-prolyl cis-trans isomerase